MNPLQTTFRSLASRLIASYGRQVTLIVAGDSDYDPATGNDDAGSTNVLVNAYVQAFDATDRPQGEVMTGDLKVLIASSSLTTGPTTADNIQIDVDVYNILSVVAQGNVNDKSSYYEVQARHS